jgi:hypothetical protein
MLIATWKRDDEGRRIKYDSPYATAQLLAPYAALLGESEEAALSVRRLGGAIVTTRRIVSPLSGVTT